MAERDYPCLWATTAATIHQQATYTLLLGKKSSKALELRILLPEQLLAIVGTEQSDSQHFMHRVCFSLFIYICSSEKLFSTVSMLWKCKSFYCIAGQKTDKCISLPETRAFTTSLCFSNKFLDSILSRKWHNISLCTNLIVWRLTWHN